MPPTFKLSRSKTATFVGLDIQPGYVAAVQARVNGSISVERAAGAPLPGDTVREGEVLNPEALSEVLRDVFQKSQLSRNVRLGIANQRTVLRMLELPPVTDRKELATAVRFQAEDQIPMPLSNAVLDFQPLGVIDTPGGPRQRVVVVAAQRDMVERLLAAVRDAGLRPEGVDLSAFAMIRSLYRSDGPQEDGRVLYLNVGGLTNMAIADGPICHFTRVVGGGLEAMAVEIAERREMSLEQSQLLLRAAGDSSDSSHSQPQPIVPAPIEQRPTEEVGYEQEADYHLDLGLSRPIAQDEWTPASEMDTEVQTPELFEPQIRHDVERDADADGVPSKSAFREDMLADVRMVLENGAREIAGEVRNSLDFHRAQEGGGKVSSVILSGAALEIDGFAQTLQHHLALPVRCEMVNTVERGSDIEVSPHRLAIAAGLVAEEVHSS